MMQENGYSGEPLLFKHLCLQTARLCIDCRMTCRNAQEYSSGMIASGKDEYRMLSHLAVECERRCRAIADLCLSPGLLQPEPAADCAKACERFANRCEALNDPLQGLAAAAREAARSCWKLAQSLNPAEHSTGS